MEYVAICSVLLLIWIKIAYSQVKEYCAGERFQASCPRGNVIVMRSAEYGRMRLGRCITEDMGYLGCSSNVLKPFDTMCSNKQTCESHVTDVDIPTPGSCSRELKNNLEAGYDCQKVLQIDCSSDKTTTIDKETFISSSSLSSCGANIHYFSALPSQRLNITMIDFTWSDQGASCRDNYGTLRDSISSNSIDICGGDKREKKLMVSNSHLVEFQPKHSGAEKSFLLKFQVSGCGDVTAPDGAWVRREGDELLFGCTSGKHTWTLRCEGNQWIGATGQCGTRVASVVSESKPENDSIWGISPAILAFAACSCLMFLASVIFLLTVCVHATRSQDLDTNHIYVPRASINNTLPIYHNDESDLHKSVHR